MNKHRHIPSSFDNTKTTWNNFEVEVEIAASWLVAAWCFEAGASIAVKKSVTKHKLLRSTMDLNLMLSPCYLGAKNIRTLIFNLMIKQGPLGKCCFVRLIPYWWEFPTCDCSEKSVKKLKMLSSIWPRTRHLQKRVSPTDTCPLDTNSNGNEQFSFLGKIIPKTAEKEIKPTCIEFWDIAFVVFEAKEGMIHDVWLIQEILQLIGGSLLVPCSQPWYTNQLMRSSSFTGPLNHLFPWLLRT